MDSLPMFDRLCLPEKNPTRIRLFKSKRRSENIFMYLNPLRRDDSIQEIFNTYKTTRYCCRSTTAFVVYYLCPAQTDIKHLVSATIALL